MEFDAYLADMPLLHSWDQGKTWNSGGFEPGHLRRLNAFLKTGLPANPRILETGAGNSTISFTFLNPSKQLAICPDPALFARIRDYCDKSAISASALRLIEGRSEWTLPELAATARRDGETFDFALIDGLHNWPTVFVDFFYINAMLKSGSYLMIDDVHLHSVKELARFLADENAFTIALDLGKALVFRKTVDAPELDEWNHSPYIVRRTKDYEYRRNLFATRPEKRYVKRKNPYAL